MSHSHSSYETFFIAGCGRTTGTGDARAEAAGVVVVLATETGFTCGTGLLNTEEPADAALVVAVAASLFNADSGRDCADCCDVEDDAWERASSCDADWAMARCMAAMRFARIWGAGQCASERARHGGTDSLCVGHVFGHGCCTGWAEWEDHPPDSPSAKKSPLTPGDRVHVIPSRDIPLYSPAPRLLRAHPPPRRPACRPSTTSPSSAAASQVSQQRTVSPAHSEPCPRAYMARTRTRA